MNVFDTTKDWYTGFSIWYTFKTKRLPLWFHFVLNTSYYRRHSYYTVLQRFAISNCEIWVKFSFVYLPLPSQAGILSLQLYLFPPTVKIRCKMKNYFDYQHCSKFIHQTIKRSGKMPRWSITLSTTLFRPASIISWRLNLSSSRFIGPPLAASI